jgi:ATP-dependent DNA helicase RecQ
MYRAERAKELLVAGCGRTDVGFRDGQEEAIRNLVEDACRLLVVQKTGWGKSFVYFIATKLLREQGQGPALLVSPLLALMRNQIAAAERMGVAAATVHSDNKTEWREVERRLLADQVDILLVSPERFANEHFFNQVLAPIAARISLLVIDEAHCISDWGHDFRPHYRRIERVLRALPRNLRLLATTATANARVRQDLTEILGPDLVISQGDLHRPSLFLQTIHLPSQAERLAWLAENVPRIPGHGIIYTLTIRDALQVTAWLKSQGLSVEAYTGQTGEQRPRLEQDLLDNRVKALVATTALGMGFDKPDLAFVIHYQSPGSVVAYYQQVGRAGRALDVAYGTLLCGSEDTEITDFFRETAFPTRTEVDQVVAALANAPEGLEQADLMAQVNVSQGRINRTLDLLALESPAPLVKEGRRWRLTSVPLGESFWQRAERLTALRRQEQLEMQDYARLASGHMEYLIRALDGPDGQFAPPPLAPLPELPEGHRIQEAQGFLRRTSLPIEPRKRWPPGGLRQAKLAGKISPENKAQPGRALCVWRDAGWGEQVAREKYQDGRFSDALVAAMVNLVSTWHPQPAPTWVTCVPSLRHPELVPDFARRLAGRLAIPFLPVLAKCDARPEQKTRANSVWQARNVDGSLALVQDDLPTGSVFLIDDVVDSRWTLTLSAWLLLSHGSGVVFPLALAVAGTQDKSP